MHNVNIKLIKFNNPQICVFVALQQAGVYIELQFCMFAADTLSMEGYKNRFDSVIFDLDGTLWDATGTVAKAWQRANEELNSIKPEQISKEMVVSITGMTYDAIFEKLFPYVTTEERNRFKAVFARHELEMVKETGGELYHGLQETLAYLKTKYQLFIVSNCQNGYIENFLDYSGLHGFFEAHQCFGTKTQPKDENITDIVNDYQLQNPVYVGDTMGDFEAAQKAGVSLIFASYGFGKVEKGQIASINSFDELQQLL